MTDKDKVFGSDLNDSKPRMAGRIPIGGLDFQVSPTDGLNPAMGKSVESTKNLKNED